MNEKFFYDPYEKIKKPKRPPIRILREGVLKICDICASSYITQYQVFKIGIRKKRGCLNPECDNYIWAKS